MAFASPRPPFTTWRGALVGPSHRGDRHQAGDRGRAGFLRIRIPAGGRFRYRAGASVLPGYHRSFGRPCSAITQHSGTVGRDGFAVPPIGRCGPAPRRDTCSEAARGVDAAGNRECRRSGNTRTSGHRRSARPVRDGRAPAHAAVSPITPALPAYCRTLFRPSALAR